MLGQKNPHPADEYIGNMIRFRRQILGMSQIELAGALTIDTQELNRIERGDIALNPLRLYKIAKILQVEPGYFIEGYTDEPNVAVLQFRKLKPTPGPQ